MIERRQRRRRAPRRARRGRGALPGAGAVAAARRAPAVPVRAPRGVVRRRGADADVRPHAARRRELRARARRVRHRPASVAGAGRAALRLRAAGRRRRRATCSTSSSSGARRSAARIARPSVQRFREMIGRDEKMLVIFEWIRTAAKSDISVLILGPTGSGKEVVARMIHELSRRGTHRFQAVNCAALPDTLFESEIFGYEKGAFTGAHDRKPGRLELANNGTLFLDEIGDMSLIGAGQAAARARGAALRAARRQHVDRGELPADLGDQPAARSVRPRHALPRGSLLPRQRVLDPAAVAARARERHPGAGAALPRRATARPTACRSTARASRRKPPTCCCSTTGRATSASSRARSSRAALSSPGRVIRPARHRVPARQRSAGRSRRASACRRSPTPSAPTSPACSRASTGTRSRRRRSSKSAAARSTARSSNTAWKRAPPRVSKQNTPSRIVAPNLEHASDRQPQWT